MARPTKYNAEIQKQADHYADKGYADHEHAVPSVVGLAQVLGVVCQTLYNWGEEHEEFLETLEALGDNQELVTLNKSLTGEFSAPISKLLLHNRGYSDKSDINNTGQIYVVPDRD